MRKHHISLSNIVSFAVIADIVPDEVVVQVLGRNAMEPIQKLIQPAVIAVDVLDVIDAFLSSSAFDRDDLISRLMAVQGIRTKAVRDHDGFFVDLPVVYGMDRLFAEDAEFRHYGDGFLISVDGTGNADLLF